MNLIQYVASYGDLLPPEEPEAKRSSTAQKRKVSYDLWFIINTLRDKLNDRPILIGWYQPCCCIPITYLILKQKGEGAAASNGNKYTDFSVKRLLVLKMYILAKKIYIVHRLKISIVIGLNKTRISQPLVILIRAFFNPTIFSLIVISDRRRLPAGHRLRLHCLLRPSSKSCKIWWVKLWRRWMGSRHQEHSRTVNIH